ncbi:MAG: hypothetical protein VYA34_05770 [Myxococcota bacterium]|nr:hypothetical protein [Myxococcota bacterium]
MAGGPNAQFVMCMQCASKSTRIDEGDKIDKYLCDQNGHEFSQDWSQEGPPSKPEWPPSVQRLRAYHDKYITFPKNT